MTHETAAREARLAQYSLTARGQLTAGRSATRLAGTELAGYAAAVGAGLAMAGAADAGIIYSGVRNISVSIDPAVQATTDNFYNVQQTAIDLDGGGADVVFGAGMLADLGAGGSAASSVKYRGGGYLYGIGGAYLLGTGTGYFNIWASKLDAGALIGPGGSFGGSAAGQARAVSVTSGSSTSTTEGNFAPSANGFVGIRLGSGNFGWIRLHLDDLGLNQPFATLLGGFPLGDGLGYPDRITVIDWAYEDSGAAIRAGAGAVPEPAPLALLAAGAAGIGALRRRKAARAHQG